MGQVQDILSEMAAMAGSGEHSGAFSQLQGRLSSLVGAEGQGDAGRKSGATFDGIAIFGPQGGLEVDTGLSSAPALSVPATNLRQGAIQALTGRGAQGGFAIGAGSPQAASAVSAAIAEASAAAGAINRADGAVSAASAGTLADADPVPGLDAADASLGAAKAIASSWNLALAAQSQGPAQAAFGLLQSA
jgi:hypothetical protein